jgi:hypothetical protein
LNILSSRVAAAVAMKLVVAVALAAFAPELVFQ